MTTRIAYILGAALLLAATVLTAWTSSASAAFAVQEPGQQGSPDTTQVAVLYSDDFSDPESGWSQLSDEAGDRFYEDGEYVVHVKEPDGWIWSTGSDEDFDDFSVEVDARLIDGPEDTRYGLVFRQQDGDNFYYFRINPGGRYQVRKRVNGNWQAVANMSWTATPHLEPGNATNRLGVIADGPEITLLANGEELTTFRDESFDTGQVGVIVLTPEDAGPATVAFDNFRVTVPQETAGVPAEEATPADEIGELSPPAPAETAVPDTTSELARLVRRAREGATVTLGAGTYQLNGPLEIGKPIALVGAGVDETVIEGTFGPSMVRFTGAGDLTLAGITFRYVGEGNANVLVIDDGVVDIADSRISGAVWDATAGAGGSGLLLWANSAGAVRNSRFDGNDLHGIELKEQAQLTIEGNVLTENSENGIAFFDASSGVVRNNDCSSNGLHGIGVADEASSTIEANTCNDNGETGIRLSGQSRSEVRGNETVRNGLHGIIVLEDAQVTLDGNFANENAETGIVFFGRAGGDVRGNECSSNGLHGIGLEEQAQAILEDNQCLGNGENGIIFFGEATGEAVGNECSFNALHGIGVEGSGSPLIEGNICEGNHEAGIRLSGTTTGRIVGNISDGNQLHGIHLGQQASPILEDNVVRNNVEGGLVYFDQAGGVARRTECYGNNWGIYVEETANPSLEQNNCYDNTEADIDDRRQAAPLGATPAPGAQGTPATDILYADDFSSPSSGWDVGEWEDGKVWYGDRGLHILNYTDSEYGTWSGAGQSFADAVIEVDSQLIGGTDDNWHEIYCRRTDADDYYYGGYSADGYFAARAQVDGERVIAFDPERSDAIRQGVDEVNRMRLSCVGDTIRFFVNEELLVEFSDAHLAEGDIALGASSLAGELTEVAFDNLVVYASEGADAASVLAGQAVATVNSAGLNVRAGPGAQYGRLIEVRRGDELPVMGRNAGCTWVQVATSAGPGWVNRSYVDLSVDCMQLPLVAASGLSGGAFGR